MIWLLNVLFPGSGLVLLRREWLGLVLAFFFATCLSLYIAGTWIAPVVMPVWLVYTCLLLAVLGWGFAQWFAVVRHRELAVRTAQADDLLQDGQRFVTEGKLSNAIHAFEAARVLDPERPDLLLRLAQLLDQTGDQGARNDVCRQILQVAPRSQEAEAARKWYVP